MGIYKRDKINENFTSKVKAIWKNQMENQELKKYNNGD